MLVNDPMLVNTLRNWSGRSHATVNAQMPPELAPAIIRPSGLAESLYCFATSGRISSSRNLAYVSPSESYSTLRLDRRLGLPLASVAGSPGLGGKYPGLTKTPIVT